MHGLYKRFLLFCAVFVALIFAVVGFWLLLGVTCSCAVLVLADMPERLSGRLNRGLDVWEVLSVGAAGVGGFVGVARVGRDGVRHPFWRVAEGVNDAER